MLRGIFGSGGGAAIGGGGTSSPSTIPRWTGPSTLGDSVITQSGAVGLEAITISRASATNNPLVVLSTPSGTSQQLFLRGGTAVEYFDFFRSNATGALHVQGSQAGFNNICLAPTSGSVGIGTASPGYRLDVNVTPGSASGAVLSNGGSGNDIARWTVNTTTGEILFGQARAAAGSYFLTFYTAGSERARIDSSGNFIVGVTTASALFTLYDAAAPELSWKNSGGRSSIAGNGQDIYINCGNGGAAGTTYFRRSSSYTISWKMDPSGHFLAGADNTYDIGASGATRPRTVYVGTSFDASASGAGLKLPATPGNADTQTLDCYLDGGASGGATWTPVDNSGAGLTLTVTSARYLRVGRLVVASFDITFPATASVVQAKISLPVTAQAVWQGASIGFGPNVPGLTAAVNNADLNFWTYGAATTNAALSGARLIVSMSYFAN